MYYTAVLFAHNWLAEEGTYTVTREVQTCELKVIFSLLVAQGNIKKENVDTILLMKNGKHSPEVVNHWSMKDNHFKGL